MSLRKALGLFLVTFLFLALPVGAQEDSSAPSVDLGPQLSWGDDTDFAIGVRAGAMLEGINPALMGIASFNYFFPSNEGIEDIDVSFFIVNADVAYTIALPDNPGVIPYLGGGLHLARGSVSVLGESLSDSELGFNAFAGVSFGASQPRYFVELRSHSRGSEQIVVTFGALW